MIPACRLPALALFSLLPVAPDCVAASTPGTWNIAAHPTLCEIKTCQEAGRQKR